MAPAVPMPIPISADPAITAWSVSPAPLRPEGLQDDAVLLEDPGFHAERGSLVGPCIDLSDRNLHVVSRPGGCRDRDAKERHRHQTYGNPNRHYDLQAGIPTTLPLREDSN